MTERQLTDPVHGTSDPNRLWTTTNVAEATPEILSPLCWSVFGDGLERAWLSSMGEFGVLSARERIISDDPNHRSTAAVLGRQAVNIAVLRRIIARLPGVNPDDVERDIFGSVRPGLPREPGAPARLPVIAVKFPLAMLRIDARVRAMHEEQKAWWQREIFDSAGAGSRTRGQAYHRLQEGYGRFGNAMALHAQIRFLLPAAEKPVEEAFTKIGRPEIAREFLSAFGGVAETAMADALWAVAHGERTQADFLHEYGFHGPNEGNVYTYSWRERPERVTALVAAYVRRTDLERPRELEAGAMRMRQSRENELLALLSPPARRIVRFAQARTAGLTRKLELGKAAFLMALDGCRAAARELGTALVAEGVLDEIDDAFFLTVPEHHELHTGTLSAVDARRLVAYRREQRELYRQVALPRSWTGMPDLQELLAAAPDPHMPDADALSVRGVAWGGGVVEGPARVVSDSHEDVELLDGEILVCRFTDPSWAPLFTMAEALVIDIGGPLSHGAVVAREMGIPFVIGTDHGTQLLRTGDLLRVDGTTGEVAVLKRAATPGDH